MENIVELKNEIDELYSIMNHLIRLSQEVSERSLLISDGLIKTIEIKTLIELELMKNSAIPKFKNRFRQMKNRRNRRKK